MLRELCTKFGGTFFQKDGINICDVSSPYPSTAFEELLDELNRLQIAPETPFKVVESIGCCDTFMELIATYSRKKSGKVVMGTALDSLEKAEEAKRFIEQTDSSVECHIKEVEDIFGKKYSLICSIPVETLTWECFRNKTDELSDVLMLAENKFNF